MYQYKGLEDTIVAIATPAGVGGLGIVRLSGVDALTVADRCIRLKSGKQVSKCAGYSVHYGWVVDIDEVLVTVMRGPKSYTAQDVVEISCHGGMASVRAILEMMLTNGARLAEPGEFTKRAFINGRIDLPQAEAVLDVIRAKTDAFLRVSTHQLKGDLSLELEAIRGELSGVYINIEALINFPEDDVDAVTKEKILSRVVAQQRRVEALLNTSNHGRILKDGIRIVLCGKPNVGKSSLLNVLLKQQRAIVTDIAGTTRDVLEEQAQIKGIALNLVDTAGILEPRDLIEEEAIKRSHQSIEGADLVLLVLDYSKPLEEADWVLINRLQGRNALVVINKVDLTQGLEVGIIEERFPRRVIQVSATTKNAIESLETSIIQCVCSVDDIEHHGVLISNVRHIQSLKQTQSALAQTQALMAERASWEFISEEIKVAVNQLDAITGRNIDQDLLEKIFSEFCIGK